MWFIASLVVWDELGFYLLAPHKLGTDNSVTMMIKNSFADRQVDFWATTTFSRIKCFVFW